MAAGSPLMLTLEYNYGANWRLMRKDGACKSLPVFFGVCFAINLYFGEENDICFVWLMPVPFW